MKKILYIILAIAIILFLAVMLAIFWNNSRLNEKPRGGADEVLTSTENSSEKIYSPQEVWDNREQLVGETLVIEGRIDSSLLCTKGPPGTNNCGGSLGFRLKGNYQFDIAGLYLLRPVGCSGHDKTNGGVDVKCYPLESGQSYRVLARVMKKNLESINYNYYSLEIKSFRRL